MVVIRRIEGFSATLEPELAEFKVSCSHGDPKTYLDIEHLASRWWIGSTAISGPRVRVHSVH